MLSHRKKVITTFLLFFFLLILFFIWNFFFRRHYLSWNETVVLHNGDTITIHQDFSNTVFYGHPHIISWGADDPWFKLTISTDDLTLKWKGKNTPIIIDNYNDQYYLVTHEPITVPNKGEVKRFHFLVYNKTINKWSEISIKQFPQQVALQNIFKNEFNQDVTIDKIGTACFMGDLSSDKYEPSLTEYLWPYFQFPNAEDAPYMSKKEFVDFRNRWFPAKSNAYCKIKAIPELIDYVNQHPLNYEYYSHSIRKAIVYLGRFGTQAKSATQALKRLLNSDSCAIQHLSLEAILNINPKEKSVLNNSVIKWFKQSSCISETIQTLKKHYDLSSLPEGFIPYIRELVRNAEKKYNHDVIQIVGYMGQDAKQFKAKLWELTRSSNCDAKGASYISLLSIDFTEKANIAMKLLEWLLSEEGYCKKVALNTFLASMTNFSEEKIIETLRASIYSDEIGTFFDVPFIAMKALVELNPSNLGWISKRLSEWLKKRISDNNGKIAYCLSCQEEALGIVIYDLENKKILKGSYKTFYDILSSNNFENAHTRDKVRWAIGKMKTMGFR